MAREKKPLASHPSRTRLKRERETGRANRAERIDTFDQSAAYSNEELLERRKVQKARRSRIRLGVGVAAVTGTLGALWLAGELKDTKPVDVSKLPRDQVARIRVTAEGSHLPSGIASDVINDNADLTQVTEEIQGEVNSDIVPTGTEIKLPKDQVDLAAVKQYESGR